jgi:hypothetical protein
MNGVFLGAQIFPPIIHTAEYWNDIITIDPAVLIAGVNEIAIEVISFPFSTHSLTSPLDLVDQPVDISIPSKPSPFLLSHSSYHSPF